MVWFGITRFYLVLLVFFKLFFTIVDRRNHFLSPERLFVFVVAFFFCCCRFGFFFVCRLPILVVFFILEKNLETMRFFPALGAVDLPFRKSKMSSPTRSSSTSTSAVPSHAAFGFFLTSFTGFLPS